MFFSCGPRRVFHAHNQAISITLPLIFIATSFSQNQTQPYNRICLSREKTF